MKTSAELSLYPLTENYEAPIISFIQLLTDQAGIEVSVNGLSTQISGEYDAVLNALTVAMKPSIQGLTTCSFVIKILNVNVKPGEVIEI